MSIELLILSAVFSAAIGGLIRQHQTGADHPLNDGIILGFFLGVVGVVIVLLTKPKATYPRSPGA